MPTNGATAVTTADLRASLDGKGNAARVFEILEKDSVVIQNATWVEGDLPNGNRTVVQGSKDVATKRRYERGVAKSKTVDIPKVDMAAQYAANVEVDLNKLEEYPDPKAYLNRQERRKISAMHEDFESDFFYGNDATDPEDIRGLATRFNTLSSNLGDPGYQVYSAGGSNNLTSLYLAGFGDGGVNLFYPFGSEAGVTRIVNPSQRVTDTNNKVYYAYCIFNNWKSGLSVENHRSGVLRIANIDSAALAGETPPDLIGIALRAMMRVKRSNSLKYAWFGNETALGWLATMYKNTNNLNITMRELQDGMQEIRLCGIPVFQSYAIINSESQIS